MGVNPARTCSSVCPDHVLRGQDPSHPRRHPRHHFVGRRVNGHLAGARHHRVGGQPQARHRVVAGGLLAHAAVAGAGAGRGLRAVVGGLAARGAGVWGGRTVSGARDERRDRAREQDVRKLERK